MKELRINAGCGCYLSPLRADDAAALVRLLNDRDIYRNTLRIPFPYTESDAEAFIRLTAEAASKQGHPVHFAIRDANHQLMGGCGFESVSYGHRAEIGYWLGKPYWGQGVMTAVVGSVCDFAIAQWKLNRISAHVFEFNVASARVLEKNAFQCEGTLRKHHRKDGEFLNSKLYALVTPDA